MLILKELKPNLIPSGCLALGTFDGVHLGHKKVILDAVTKAKSIDAIATIVTFLNHPQSVLKTRKSTLLTTQEKKLEIFKELGVQATVLLDFTPELSKMSPDKYLKEILVASFNPKTISTGYNHLFGAAKKGDNEFLKQNEQKYGYKTSVIEPVKINDKVVSSSMIRKLLKEGDTKQASQLLGRFYSLENIVVQGEQRGRLLGFPTANLEIPEYITIPQGGVYSGFVYIKNRLYKAVINIGKRPTYGDLKSNLIEVHIVDFNDDLYGKKLEVYFYSKIRDEIMFMSENELKIQIQKDVYEMQNTSIKLDVAL